MKDMMSSPSSTTPLQGQDRAMVFEIMNTAARSNLIPRVMNTNIMVYMMNADILLNSKTNNSQLLASAAAARRAPNTRSASPSPLYVAVLDNNLELVKRMLNEPINALVDLMEANSIVRAAITNQNQEMLETILKVQPDLINNTDEEGLTPLSYAAYNGFTSMVCYILEKFPAIRRIRNNDKSYPIHKACLGGHVEVLKVFYSLFPESLLADVHNGRTVLHIAAKERSNKLKHVVVYLLSLKESKELLKKKDENGRIPLDLANNVEVGSLIKRNMC
uniref:Uncharacterized protein n=1 Tax=Chenopodium quinoa TaxID=63459 RepID=A0A803KVY2_CHEQI